MKTITIRSLFAQLHQRLFVWCFNREINKHTVPHLQQKSGCGYSFNSSEEMDLKTAKCDVASLIDTIEDHWRKMPESYEAAFRYLVHRDLHSRLVLYERIARQHIHSTSLRSRSIVSCL